MRIPILPVALALFTAALLYSTFHADKAVLKAGDGRLRPILAIQSAVALATPLQSRAESFYTDMETWPVSLADVEFDPDWPKSHRGVESVQFTADGSISVLLSAAKEASATRILWAPSVRGHAVKWICTSDFAAIRERIRGCSAVPAADLDAAAQPAAYNERPIEVSSMNDRCQTYGDLAHAAAHARTAGVEIENFVRRPIVAFRNDEDLRRKLDSLARAIYQGPLRSPNAAERDLLRLQGCL